MVVLVRRRGLMREDAMRRARATESKSAPRNLSANQPHQFKLAGSDLDSDSWPPQCCGLFNFNASSPAIRGSNQTQVSPNVVVASHHAEG